LNGKIEDQKSIKKTERIPKAMDEEEMSKKMNVL
jgi:hypothetical protein